MASKQLSFLVFCLLLSSSCPQLVSQEEPEAQQLQVPRPRGRIRIADMQPPSPQGSSNWPSFGAVAPIALPVPVGIPVPISSTVHSHIPLLREEIGSSTQNVPSEGRLQEAVVYGNWKPEHPLKPDQDEGQTKQRVYGRLEAMLMGLPAEAMDRRETSSEEVHLEQEQRTAPGDHDNLYARRDSYERSQESRGRWRIPTPNANLQSQLQPQAPFEVVRMNASDPLLRAMAKQINESIETTTARRVHTQTTEDNWMPLPYPYPTHSLESTQPFTGMESRVRSSEAPTLSPVQAAESTTMSLNWPTDFLDVGPSSTEHSVDHSIDRIDHIDSIDRIDEDIGDQGDDYKYYEESLNSAQMHSELSVPESLVPQLPLNITRVGIPYEDRNSNEEPTICVPLTVSETAAESTTALLVEVERVYCFPLPKVEIRTGNIKLHQPPPMEQEQEHSTSGSITTLPTEQSQPALTAGARRRNTLALLIIICSSILARL